MVLIFEASDVEAVKTVALVLAVPAVIAAAMEVEAVSIFVDRVEVAVSIYELVVKLSDPVPSKAEVNFLVVAPHTSVAKRLVSVKYVQILAGNPANEEMIWETIDDEAVWICVLVLVFTLAAREVEAVRIAESV